jgi:hypothetical protein
MCICSLPLSLLLSSSPLTFFLSFVSYRFLFSLLNSLLSSTPFFSTPFSTLPSTLSFECVVTEVPCALPQSYAETKACWLPSPPPPANKFILSAGIRQWALGTRHTEHFNTQTSGYTHTQTHPHTDTPACGNTHKRTHPHTNTPTHVHNNTRTQR